MELQEYMTIIKNASDEKLEALSIVDNWPIVTDLELNDLFLVFKDSDKFDFRLRCANYYSFGYVSGTVIVDLKYRPESFPIYSKDDPDDKKMHHKYIMENLYSTAKLHPYLHPESAYYPGKAMEGVSKSRAMVLAIEDIVKILDRRGASYCFPRSYEGFGEDYSKVIYHHAK